jgi:hypothetical protein
VSELDQLAMRRSAEGQVAIELDRLLDGHSRTHARIIALRAALRTLPFSQQGLMRNGRYVSSEPWEWTASRTAMLASVMAVRGIDRASLAALGLIDALEVSVPIDQQQIYDLFQMLRSAFTEADEATAILLAKRVIVEAILIGADAAGDLALRSAARPHGPPVFRRCRGPFPTSTHQNCRNGPAATHRRNQMGNQHP